MRLNGAKMGLIRKVLLLLGHILSTGFVAGEIYREKKWVGRITATLAIILGIAGLWGLFSGGVGWIESFFEHRGAVIADIHRAHTKQEPRSTAVTSALPVSATSNRDEPVPHRAHRQTLTPDEQLAHANDELDVIGKHIYFEIGSPTLDAPGIRTVKAWARLLKKYPALRATLKAFDRMNTPAQMTGNIVTVPQVSMRHDASSGMIVPIGADRVSAVSGWLVGSGVDERRVDENVSSLGNLDIAGRSPSNGAPEIIPVDQSVTLVLKKSG